jgi:hypothetical protein
VAVISSRKTFPSFIPKETLELFDFGDGIAGNRDDVRVGAIACLIPTSP